MKRSFCAALFLVLFLPSAWLLPEQKPQRPPNWAQPVHLDGVANLFQVSETLYRSAQPTAIGMQKLKELGIVTVINLRAAHSDRDEIGDLELVSKHIPMHAWHPKRRQAVDFLRIVTDPGRAPVLVHCQHGSDRTGVLCAVYRVVVQGWSKEEAIREMIGGGYGFHSIWSNLPRWLRRLNIPLLVQELGSKAKT